MFHQIFGELNKNFLQIPEKLWAECKKKTKKNAGKFGANLKNF